MHVQACLQADDVVGEQAFQNRLPHRGRKHLQISRLRPWDMDEVLQHRLGERRANVFGSEVELVVLSQKERTAG